MGQALSNPAALVRKLKTDAKQRGIPTIEEVVKLFRDSSIWRDERHYLMSKLSMLTGMHQGELIGLQRQYVSECTIFVEHSWEAGQGLKGPKTKKSRRPVYFPKKFSDELQVFMEAAHFQDGDDFVFYTHVKGINTSFYKALAKMGVDEEERKDRHIVFHSLRHFFSSYLDAQEIPMARIRDFMGHTAVSITEGYTHRDIQKMFKDILPLQEQLLIP